MRNINWKNFAITGLVVGMVAVTGCSSNLPETNQGNRNGQRVADAVNRREDTYRTTSNRLAYTENSGTYHTNGALDRTTRNIRHAADKITHPTRNTTRNTVNNPLNVGRPQGRIGNAFHYGNETSHVTGLNEVTAYDMGVTASEQALVNTRTTRNTTVNPAVAPATTAVTTPKTDTKRIDTKRKATPAKKVETTTENKSNLITPTVSVIRQAPAVVAPTNHRTITNKPVTRSRHNNVKTHNNVNRNSRYGMSLNTNAYGIGTLGGETLGLNPYAEQSVVVTSTDDMAFFRKKTEEPTTPEVTPPATMPAPESSDLDSSYDDSGYDDYDIYEEYDAVEAVPARYTSEEKPPTTRPVKVPTRTANKRAMK